MSFIGLDLGTSAIKGVCWDAATGIRRTVNEKVALDYPKPSHVEIDPLRYEEQVYRILRHLAEASDGAVGGMAFAAASGNTLLCDGDGNPRTPIISWLDKRLTDWRPPAEWAVRATCGWPAIPTFPLMHLEHFRRTSPETLRASTVSMNNCWLTWRLCGIHALDYSNATPFYLVDQEARRYAPYLDHYGLDEGQLPRLVNPGELIGTLRPELCGGQLTPATKVVGGSFDHPAAARSAHIDAPGALLLSCGTSWVGFYAARNRRDIPDYDLCDCYQSASGGCWGGMFSVAEIGRELASFVLAHYGDSSDNYRQFNADALTAGTESRAMLLKIIDRFREKFVRHPGVTRLVLCGGPSEGESVPKLLEKSLGLPVTVSPYRSYAGAVGAAILASQP
ncbi:MAG: hypothetical protein IJJ33_19970 [Victivallales bacterium]|nr:hypothetical protein [Victivallales bacterium]